MLKETREGIKELGETVHRYMNFVLATLDLHPHQMGEGVGRGHIKAALHQNRNGTVLLMN